MNNNPNVNQPDRFIPTLQIRPLEDVLDSDDNQTPADNQLRDWDNNVIDMQSPGLPLTRNGQRNGFVEPQPGYGTHHSDALTNHPNQPYNAYEEPPQNGYTSQPLPYGNYQTGSPFLQNPSGFANNRVFPMSFRPPLQSPMIQQSPLLPVDTAPGINPIGQEYVPHKAKIMSVAGVSLLQIIRNSCLQYCCTDQRELIIQEKGAEGTSNTPQDMYACEERSHGCSRNCFSGKNRSLKLKINNLSARPGGFRSCLLIRKAAYYTPVCMNTPQINVYYTEEGEEEYIGKLMFIQTCDDIILNVYNQGNDVVYKLITDFCQFATCCSLLPCSACNRLCFEIRDRQNRILSSAVRKNKAKTHNEQSAYRGFEFEFPAYSNWQERSLLLAAVMTVEFMLFSQKTERFI